MKYLKKFQTTAGYNAYTADTANFIIPNVSLVDETNNVYYNPNDVPPTPPTPGHDYVEIAGTKWATMNIGASSVTDYGLYFQWGDTSGYTASQVGNGSGQKYFGWGDYKYGISTDLTKYNSTDGKTVLDASDDAATVIWGEGWRMPTTSEYIALSEAVTTFWVINYQGSGISGLKCVSKDGSGTELFFPAAGYFGNGNVTNVGANGDYWSSSVVTSDKKSAYIVYSHSENRGFNGTCERFYGFPIRPVKDA